MSWNVKTNRYRKGYVIVFKCIKCGAIRKNKVAEDDNKEEIYKIIEQKKYN